MKEEVIMYIIAIACSIAFFAMMAQGVGSLAGK